MTPKTGRFELRIESELLERLDAWRATEEDQPSRAEAIRRLLEAGLAHDNKGRVPRISDGEKLIVAMLADVATHLKVKGETDIDLVKKVMYGGHYWALGWEMPGLFHGHADKQAQVRFVVDVLDMWSFIEEAMATLSAADKKRIEKEAHPFGADVMFSGFDGNNESTYLSIARFLVEDLERFSFLKGRDLNSHAPLVGAYRRMLDLFLPMRTKLIGRKLSAAEIIALMKERMQPSRRQVGDK